MDTTFARPSKINMDPSGQFGQAEYGNDKLNVTFYTKAVLDQIASKESNTPYYKNIIYVTIHPPGERLNIVDRPATDEDKMRWPMQWQRFTLNKTQVPEGTPVDVLFPNHPAVAATLKGNGIYTIQQLAELSANAIDSLGMGAMDFVTKAKRFLQEAGDSKAYQELRRQLEEKDHRIEYLEKVFEQQAQTIKQLQVQMGKFGPIDHSQHNLGHIASEDTQTARINSVHASVDEKPKKSKRLSMTEIENM